MDLFLILAGILAMLSAMLVIILYSFRFMKNQWRTRPHGIVLTEWGITLFILLAVWGCVFDRGNLVGPFHRCPTMMPSQNTIR